LCCLNSDLATNRFRNYGSIANLRTSHP
jgi:hypothetical protein